MEEDMTENISKILSEIDTENLPVHIGIIMDGNGRWAKQRGLPRHLGHQEGMKKVVQIVEACNEIEINNLTLYAFSTENWKRPSIEVEALMNLLVVFVRKELQRLHENNVKIKILGDISKLPEVPLREVHRAVELTSDNSGMTLNIALNYGGRQEITKAVIDILTDVNKGNINIDGIDEKTISEYLYTKGQPDPDLIIRPSGELRLSNFLIYQAAYSEFWFSDVLWPDFNANHLYRAIVDYQKRNRRFGGI
ncbi:isoprenyl transferase [Gudongella sp. SC589]|uniref:isoprenyl transferase n=1 Tax=Gudongella sp. SC589 TaxID=3385990 RepID=UPI003904D7E7